MSRRNKGLGYTVLKVGHTCPLPDNASLDTLVQCDECKRYWVRRPSQWLEISKP